MLRRLFSCCPTNTAIYEVNIKFLNPSVRKEYVNWLSSRHIHEVLKCEGFLSAELLEDMQASDVTVKYTLESPQVYEKYNSSEAAKALREEAINKFGDSSFSISRRVLVPNQVFYK